MKKLKTLIKILLMTSLIFNQGVVLAFKVQFNQDLEPTFTLSEDKKSLVKVGQLLKGSIVDIPDKYIQKVDNKIDLLKTITHWYNASKKIRADEIPDTFSMGDTNYDFYFQVKVVKPNPETSPLKDKVVYIPLAKFAKESDSYVILEDTDAYETQTKPSSAKNKSTEAKMVLQCSNCDPNEPFQEIASFLSEDLEKYFISLDKREDDLAKKLDAVESNFNSTCNNSTKKKTFAEFKKIIKAEVKEQELLKILDLIMAEESVGQCFNDNNGNYGLFHINYNSSGSKYKPCTNEEIYKIKNSTFAELKSAPLCLQNPILNLKEAVRILKEKETALFSGDLLDEGSIDDMDKIRLTLVAYNQGQELVRFAVNNLNEFVEFNNLNPQEISATNWDDLKPFLFRGLLSRTEQLESFGTYTTRFRRQEPLRAAVYVDSIISNIMNNPNPKL